MPFPGRPKRIGFEVYLDLTPEQLLASNGGCDSSRWFPQFLAAGSAISSAPEGRDGTGCSGAKHGNLARAPAFDKSRIQYVWKPSKFAAELAITAAGIGSQEICTQELRDPSMLDCKLLRTLASPGWSQTVLQGTHGAFPSLILSWSFA